MAARRGDRTLVLAPRTHLLHYVPVSILDAGPGLLRFVLR